MTKKVAIVGVGVAGASAASRLAPDHDVTLYDTQAPAGGATGKAAGLITLSSDYGNGDLTEYCQSFWDSEDRIAVHQRESFELLNGEADEGDSTESHSLNSICNEYDLFSPSEFGTANRYEDTGWVDPHNAAIWFLDRAREHGSTLHTGTPITGLSIESGEVVGVETALGDEPADVVVVAAGWKTPALLDDVLEMPVRPYKTQCAIVRSSEPFFDEPMGWIPSEKCYFRPTDSGGLLFGGGSQFPDDPNNVQIDEEFRNQAAEVVPKVFDAPDLKFQRGWAGVDAATPDSFPIIDAPDEGPEGLVVATGLHGRGVMASPAVGEAVRAKVAGEKAAFDLDQLALDRFDDPSDDFDFVNVSA